jgi:hypothetical protein
MVQKTSGRLAASPGGQPSVPLGDLHDSARALFTGDVPAPAVMHRYEIARRFIARKWQSAKQTGTRYTRMQVPYEGDRKLVRWLYAPQSSGGQ